MKSPTYLDSQTPVIFRDRLNDGVMCPHESTVNKSSRTLLRYYPVGIYPDLFPVINDGLNQSVYAIIEDQYRHHAF